MKKIILLSIAGVILLGALVAGVIWYQARVDDPTNTTTVPTQTTTVPTAPTETTQPSVQVHIEAPMVSISLPILSETFTADNATTIFTHTFQDVVLDLPDAEIAKTVTLDLLKRMDVNASVLGDIRTNAYQDYTGQDPWIPYYYKVLYSPQRIDQTILSLYGEEDAYGSSYSGTTGISVTYNLLTGKALKLGDVLTEEGAASEKLLQALLDALSGKKEEYMLFDDYADIISGRFQTDLQQESHWFFSTEGLCFFFSPYDIAPNASGIVVATVPYSKLTGILQDAYFPGEQPEFHGEMSATAFDKADTNQFTHYANLITDTDAPEYILHTKGVLYDIQIEQGQWFGETYFRKDSVIFHANHLSPEDALVLRASLPDNKSPLLLSYTCEGKTHRFFLTADASGNVTFTPAT